VAGISFTALVEELRADPDLAGDTATVNKSRTSPVLRYSHILGVAIERARVEGWNQMTRAAVAEAAGISEALVSHYFGTMDELRATIMQEAIRRRVVEIVAQGLAAGNVVAKGAPDEVKQAALAYMMV
jgi:AcrR family transcriptional regulator